MSTGRAYSTKLGTTAVTTPTGRLYAASLSGGPAVLVNFINSQTVEPESTVTITAVVPTPGSPTFAWRVISGGGTIVGTGATVTLVAPSGSTQAVYPPLTTQVTVGVIATIAGSASLERVATINILPQLAWFWNGTAFIGAKPYRFTG